MSVKTAIVTGSGGLIGAEATRRLVHDGFHVVGIDNDMRERFFGAAGTTIPNSQRLCDELGRDFNWRQVDIRDDDRVDEIFESTRPEIVVHCAAQPSHDWAAKEPKTDFGVNAVGTLNLLEATRKFSRDATFVHCSTSKVYGDNPNRLPLLLSSELEYLDMTGPMCGLQYTRLDLAPSHQYHEGIDTTMSIDHCLHSLFGVSKASGDLLVQEYGRYFDMPTVCFRPGCLTGGDHAGVELHGFLAYLVRATAQGLKYKIYGYDGLQVRCNVHAHDLVSAFLAFHVSPSCGAVYNIGGGRQNACSMLEAISLAEQCIGARLDWEYTPEARIGDHKFWISDNRPFQRDYHNWEITLSLTDILEEIASRC